MSTPFKILFKFATRGRVERFFNSLDSIVYNIKDVDYYHVSVAADTDDLQMCNDEVKERISKYKNVSVEWGISKSKIHAINRDMPKYPFDILVNTSDDMVFNMYGFDQCIRVDMNEHFPGFDGLLHYPDQDAKEHLATMYIAGRKWWEFRGKNIYHPSYKSLWCDNEEQEAAKIMGKYKYCGYQINVHLNPAYGYLQKDELFIKQQGFWEVDEINYYARKAKNFDL
jgi:hypothetical protein